MTTNSSNQKSTFHQIFDHKFYDRVAMPSMVLLIIFSIGSWINNQMSDLWEITFAGIFWISINIIIKWLIVIVKEHKNQ